METPSLFERVTYSRYAKARGDTQQRTKNNRKHVGVLMAVQMSWEDATFDQPTNLRRRLSLYVGFIKPAEQSHVDKGT